MDVSATQFQTIRTSETANRPPLQSAAPTSEATPAEKSDPFDPLAEMNRPGWPFSYAPAGDWILGDDQQFHWRPRPFDIGGSERSHHGGHHWGGRGHRGGGHRGD